MLVIVIDDASWEDFGQHPLPTLATYAPFGRVYDRFYVCPVCSPTRAAIWSGEHPHRHFIGTAITTEAGLPARTKSLPEALAARGYSTALFGKAHVSGLASMADSEQARVHGFETWRAGAPTNVPSHYHWSRTDDGQRVVETTYSTTAVFDAACAWWSSTAGAKFAVVAAFAPHEPFEAPPAATLPPGYVVGTTPRELYEAALLSFDWHLACLLGVIDPADTHVVLLCDNGTPHQVPPPNALSAGYKLTVHEGGIHVPLVWWGPGVAPGIDSSLVQAVDVPRTILEVCGIVPSGSFEDSLSFVDTFQGGVGPRSYAYLPRFTPNGGSAPALIVDDWAVVRADGLKLLKKGTSLDLYDLASDPWEHVPLPNTTPGYDAIVADLAFYRLQTLGPLWPY